MTKTICYLHELLATSFFFFLVIKQSTNESNNRWKSSHYKTIWYLSLWKHFMIFWWFLLSVLDSVEWNIKTVSHRWFAQCWFVMKNQHHLFAEKCIFFFLWHENTQLNINTFRHKIRINSNFFDLPNDCSICTNWPCNLIDVYRFINGLKAKKKPYIDKREHKISARGKFKLNISITISVKREEIRV